MKRVTQEQILKGERGESSDVIRSRVENARQIQRDRYRNTYVTNASARVDIDSIVESSEGRTFVESAMGAGLTGRGLTRAWKVARTIADLEHSDHVTHEHLGEALLMRLQGLSAENAA